jgi:hypothetical protein
MAGGTKLALSFRNYNAGKSGKRFQPSQQETIMNATPADAQVVMQL